MWFLIAGEQIAQAKNHVNQSMTMEQLLEAEQRAAESIRKMRKIPPSSIENPPNASTASYNTIQICSVLSRILSGSSKSTYQSKTHNESHRLTWLGDACL
jgi:hypothetical protein